ncbi:MAG: xanthine dehydrogenase molybdenum-binding subunit XdhA [Sphaerochaetaceae bacterium]|jgi:xanthine dehydrogenase molybdenum-binding subunit|nr:xanthine dehydrogenase molybdenum-binding subunit XdhA [Sphaerochaetaceae bacterium]MDD3163285.1 xanthine dehydrogenase molybdenum-binding subunit XdhA [Sphaerochaetaceae bacterium]MDD4006849.1 xanthine dehydrogenase molybdenum-binding subunit XdhA [Sphaerochaetaceae bacterium]MDD4395979.1 xanthine dehydrogenase molybdenum-binding subunit XdhA [Sphaerochaetaceae bacterium]
MVVGKPVERVDAFDKVTGRAKYTADMFPENALIAKVLHSTIANGMVISFDLNDALKVPGVVKILTCFDVPDIQYPTPGHPWSTEKKHQDIADRKLLNTHVRFYGDDIAVVIAETELAAKRALDLIQVKYEEQKAVFTVADAMAPGAPLIHDEKPGNVIVHSNYEFGSFDSAITEQGLIKVEGTYHTQQVQHCHIENASSFAYMEGDRITVVSSTQIPHIVRRICTQALGCSFGSIRIIKPYIGGGFGNKQDALTEPLNAWLTTQVGGRCVGLFYTREETFVCTRTRHAMDFDITTYVRPDGSFAARRIVAYSNQGAYASHAHALVANAVNAFRMMYPVGAIKGDAYTVYTNIQTAGAMRAYGIPQIGFALEAHIDDIAARLKADRIALRQKNMMQLGYVDPGTTITCHSTGLQQCIDKGRKFIHWDEKAKQYEHQTGSVRHGIGMAIFCYKTGVYPISLETSACRMVLNQDGTVQLQMGATEIGQGADTVFSQMCADTVGIPLESVHVISTQDTDITPYDTGAYASRQTYVCGMAVKKTGLSLKRKILEFAAFMLHKDVSDLDLKDSWIVHTVSNEKLIALSDVAMEACYSLTNSHHIAAEETHHCSDNTYSFGACFADIDVDIPLCKIHVNNIINVHDSGTIINPLLATGQVHGGMSMGLGYGLLEQMLYDPKTGRTLDDNMLDYKLMTASDTPELNVQFVEPSDPTGPFGNKALGEPPVIPVAPAIRNALLNATGVAVDSIPLSPEHLFFEFKKAGLIK